MLTSRRPGLLARSWPAAAGLPARGIILVFVGAAALRLAIMPLTYGHDFVVWNDATQLLLRGLNPYTHWRAMPNAYPYLPVFLYMLLPLQWLALHAHLSFIVLGKLPLAAADLVVGATLYRWLRRADHSTQAAGVAACLYLYNPLVLYNSAFLGRFDGVALAFLLPALTATGARFAVLYGLAVATKTFPIFILPALLVGRYRHAPRELLGAAAVIVAVAVPFLLWDPGALLYNLTVRAFANTVPLPRGLSWQYVIQGLPFYGHLGLVFYALLLGAVLWWRDRPPLTLCALTFSAFLLVDHKIWEQYLTWPLPFLIALAWLRRDIAAGLLAGGLTLAALFMNEQGNPVNHSFYMRLVPYPPITVNVLLALGIVLYVALTLRPTYSRGDSAEVGLLRHQGTNVASTLWHRRNRAGLMRGPASKRAAQERRPRA